MFFGGPFLVLSLFYLSNKQMWVVHAMQWIYI